MVYNGKLTREWLSRENLSGPTVALKSIILSTGVIDAHKEQNVMTCNILNTFIEVPMLEIKNILEGLRIKITGVLVDTLVELNPDLYEPYVVDKKTRNVL